MKRIICAVFAVMLLLPLKVSALDTSAKGAVLINGDTGEVIYEHNKDSRLPMASTTKIMTGLLLCENGDFERQITVSEEMLRVEGSSMGLLAGDKVTLGDLLYGLMLASGNDAANVIAYTLGNTVDGFVKMMNDKALELGLNNTHFETPSGLDGEDHYTTAYDLARLARIAMQNDAFAKAVSTEKAVLYYGNPPYRRSLSNHNRLLKSFDGAVGIKTGFTKKSGRCLVSAAKRDGKYVIAVTLNDPNDWADHTSLLEYGLSVIKTVEIKPPKNRYDIAVVGGVDDKTSVSVNSLSVSTLTEQNFNCYVALPKFLYAPVEKGDKIGQVVYSKEDKIIAKFDINAEEAVAAVPNKSSVTYSIFEVFYYIFINIWEK